MTKMKPSPDGEMTDVGMRLPDRGVKPTGKFGQANIAPGAGNQYPRRGAVVNRLVGNDEGGVGVSSQLYHSPEFKPPVLITGGR